MIQAKLSTTPTYMIAAVGEVLWDIFPAGPRFGGAPANFACSAAGLAGPRALVAMVSAVGCDELGKNALTALADHNVDTQCVAALEQQTGKVLIELDQHGSASYEFAADCAWDNLAWSDDLQSSAQQANVVSFGTLGQRSDISRKTVQQFVSTTSPSTIRIFDINLRPPFFCDDVILQSLELANVLKLNDQELPVLSKLCDVAGSVVDRMKQLADRYDLRAVALTRGPNGATLLCDGVVSQHAGINTNVVDTVGAGDAFTAAFALGILAGDKLETINQHACEVAAFVCSQAGATPNIPISLKRS